MASQPPPESIILGRFSGIKNTTTPESLTGADFERATNVDLDDAGQARRRRGYTLKNGAAHHSLITIANKTLVVRDGALGLLRPDYSFLSLMQVGPAPVAYTDVGDDIYFSADGGSGVITAANALLPWGATSGQGEWLSPVRTPTATLGAVAGQLLGDPLTATTLSTYNGRIYLGHDRTLWGTELYRYHYVDRTKNFMQFESAITLQMAMTDGIYVGTEGGLFFMQGSLGSFQLQMVSSAAVIPGSGVWTTAERVHPQARTGVVPVGRAAVFMTSEGVIAGMDGGNCFNLTADRVEFPRAQTAATLLRHDQGATSLVATLDSGGSPGSGARMGDYVEAEIRRFGG